MSLRVLIVDDEPIARRRLQRLVRLESDVAAVMDVGTGKDAISAIQEDRPDLVLLDVQMPDIDGFGVVEALGVDQMPPTIFVTAYHEHAIRAFDCNAIDYLLKPFDRDRFRAAFQRARQHLERLESAEQGKRMKALFDQIFGPERAAMLTGDLPGTDGTGRHHYLDRIMVKREGRVYFVRAADVDWFEASGNYIKIHVGKTAHVIRETMHNLESKLDPALFGRIHRAVIVNLDRIRELQPWFAGDYLVILKDGRQLKLSRTFRDQLQARMMRLS